MVTCRRGTGQPISTSSGTRAEVLVRLRSRAGFTTGPESATWARSSTLSSRPLVRWVGLPLVGDDADVAVALDERASHLRDVRDALLAQVAHQFVFGDELAPHVGTDQFAVVDQRE